MDFEFSSFEIMLFWIIVVSLPIAYYFLKPKKEKVLVLNAGSSFSKRMVHASPEKLKPSENASGGFVFFGALHTSGGFRGTRVGAEELLLWRTGPNPRTTENRPFMLCF
mgnify:CR=1 FL=1